MYFLRTEDSFDAAHFLKGYEGKCSNIHGHRWKVIVEVKGEDLKQEGPKRGMVVDFSDLKDSLYKICDNMDHSLIIEENSLKPATMEALRDEDFAIIEVPFRPTAENFAKYFFEKIKEDGYVVNRVEVYETPNNFAAYEE